MDFTIDLKYRKKYNFQSDYIRVGFTSTTPIKKGKLLNISEQEIGLITSSNKSFNLNKFIAIGYINKEYLNDKLQNNIKIVILPFIKQNYYRNNKK